jgi:hypothetical protein
MLNPKEDGGSPERIAGYDFRVPSIKGLGSGFGFQLAGLVLPRDFERLVAENPNAAETAKGSFDFNCRHFNLPQGYIDFDRQTGVLKQIFFGGIGIFPSATLELGYGKDKYYFDDVRDHKMALVMNKAICEYLNELELEDRVQTIHAMQPGSELPQKRYAYPDYGVNAGGGHGYCSSNLFIPTKLMEEARLQEGFEYFIHRFEVEASNLMGQFGVTPKSFLWQNKFLRGFGIVEGNACDYGVGSIMGGGFQYLSHNVDSPRQAFALHAVGAAYINHLLEDA